MAVPITQKVVRRGNYTVIEVSDGRAKGYGVSKRNPIDKDNKSVGYKLALARALRDYADAVERNLSRG